jgi:hypothetical protein
MESQENIPNNEDAVLAELKSILDAKIAEKGYDEIHHKIVAIIDALVVSGMTTREELVDTKIYHLLTMSGMDGTHKMDIEGGLLERFIREKL